MLTERRKKKDQPAIPDKHVDGIKYQGWHIKQSFCIACEQNETEAASQGCFIMEENKPHLDMAKGDFVMFYICKLCTDARKTRDAESSKEADSPFLSPYEQMMVQERNERNREQRDAHDEQVIEDWIKSALLSGRKKHVPAQ